MTTLSDRAIRMVFSQFEKNNLESRVEEYKEYKAFYDNDIDEIKDYIKDMLTDTYSEATLDSIRIIHRDIIRKVLILKGAGIYDKEPKRKLMINETEVWEGLEEFLIDCDWTIKMKEALLMMPFFNTLLGQAINRNGKLEIDLITGDECEVDVNEYDYLIAEKIYLARLNYKTNDLYLAVWTKDDHYLADTNGNEIRQFDDGTPIGNNYGLLPFAILRFRKGIDFWGEPSNNLLSAQKEFDVDLTNFNRIEEFQGFGVWCSINLDIKENETMAPNKILKAENVRSDMIMPDLKNVVPNVNFDALRANLDWNFRNLLSSEGISSQNSDTETIVESGVSKAISETETQNYREHYKWLMWKFEKELFEIARVVWNTDKLGEKIPEGEFIVEFSEEKPHETVPDKVARRNSEIQYKINTPIDFVMEDKEVDKDEAVKVLAYNMGLENPETATAEEIIAQWNSMNKQNQTNLDERNKYYMDKINAKRNNKIGENQ